MSDNMLQDLESMLAQTKDQPASAIQALLPPATNPEAHAPDPSNVTMQDFIPKRPAESAPAPVAEPVAEVIEPVVEVAPVVETAAPEAGARDALFNQLRAQFPNEPLGKIGARVDAAFSDAIEPQVQAGPDPLDDIWADFEADIQAAQEAEAKIQEFTAKSAEETVEFTEDVRKAHEASISAKNRLENHFASLESEANAVVEGEFPELNDPSSMAHKILQVSLNAAFSADPNFGQSDPTATARLGREAAMHARAITPAAPVAQPAPQNIPASPTRVAAPVGPKPPAAALASGVQAPHAPASSPAPGALQAPDMATQIRGFTSFEEMSAAILGGSGMTRTILK